MQRIQLLILLRLRQGHPRTHPLPGSHLLLALDLNRLLRRIRSNSKARLVYGSDRFISKGGLAVLAPQKLSTVTSVGSSVCAGSLRQRRRYLRVREGTFARFLFLSGASYTVQKGGLYQLTKTSPLKNCITPVKDRRGTSNFGSSFLKKYWRTIIDKG